MKAVVRWEKTQFAANLQRLRKRKGWRQLDLAGEVGVSVVTISKLECGLHEPSWPLVRRLRQALGVRYEEFDRPAPEDGTP